MSKLKIEFQKPKLTLCNTNYVPLGMLTSKTHMSAHNITLTSKANETPCLSFDIPLGGLIDNDSTELLVKHKNDYFVIKNISMTRGDTSSVTVNAEHIACELKGIIVSYFENLIGETLENMWETIITNCSMPEVIRSRYIFETNIVNTYRYLSGEDERSIYEHLVDMAEQFEACLLFSTDADGIIHIKLLYGDIDRGKFIRKGKDLKQLNLNFSTDNLFTKVTPFGATGDDGMELTIIDVNNGKSYITNYDYYLAKGMTAEEIRNNPLCNQECVYRNTDIVDAEDLLKLGKQELDKLSKPTISGTIEAIDLNVLEGSLYLSPILCEKIIVIDKDINYSISCKITEIEFTYDNPLESKIGISNVVKYSSVLRSLVRNNESIGQILTSGSNGRPNLNTNRIKSGTLSSYDRSTWINLDNGDFNFKDKFKFIDNEFAIDLGNVDVSDEVVTQINKKINSINGQLETIIHEKYYVYAHNFKSLEECVAFAKDNMKTEIRFINEIYTLKSIEIPPNLNLVGDNTTIIIDGDGLILNSNTQIKGLTFDGNLLNDRAITIKNNAKNIEILNCSFKNLKGNNERWCIGIYIDKFSENINIHDNKFSNFISHSNGVEGDEIGAVRGILFRETINSRIYNCSFETIGDGEDGDSIAVQTTPITNAEFPFNVIGYEQAESGLVICNNTFSCDNKRCIKIQASGVIVENNKAISNTDYLSYGFISILGGKNCVIKGNEITGNFRNGIDINNSKNVLIENNFINYKNTVAFAPFLIINSDIIYVTKNNFTANSKYNENNVIFTYINAQTVNNLMVTKNNFRSKSNISVNGANTVDALGLSNCNNVNIEENNFYGEYYSLLALNKTCENIALNNILIENVERGVIFKKASTNIRLTNIIFKNMNYSGANIFTWSDSSQIKSEVFTNKNISVLNGVNQLTQGSVKPSNKIEIGHEFYETSTGKFFKWTGSEWKVISLTV